MVISLLERHVIEASFVFSQRELAAGAPHHDLESLGDLDARLEAHLDALRLQAAEAFAICKDALAPEGWGAGAAFAAAEVALSSGDLPGLASVVEATITAPELASGVALALQWSNIEQVRDALGRLLAPGLPPVVRALGLRACAGRRIDPGQALDAALVDGDLSLRAEALRTVGVLGRADRADAVRKSLTSTNAACRTAAASSGALLGDPAARALLRQETSELAALLEADGGPARELASMPPRVAARYAGASGDARHIPWLLARLSDPALARVAGEALTTITGADFSRPPLRGLPPPDFAAGPSDDPADPNVAMDPDEDLRWPAEAATRGFCETFSKEAAGARTLLGQPLTEPWLLRVLHQGHQRHRALAAMALMIRRPGRPLFNVHAPAFRQVRALGPTP